MSKTDFFLKLTGIDGESEDHKHKNEIEIASFSFGASQTGLGHHGGGSGGGKAALQDVHFTTTVSKASPKLFLACTLGEHIKEGILTVRKAGKDQQEYFKVKLSDVIVSSYQVGGHGGDGVVPSEQFSLNFAKLEYEYKPQKSDGTLEAPIKTGFDIKANKKV